MPWQDSNLHRPTWRRSYNLMDSVMTCFIYLFEAPSLLWRLLLQFLGVLCFVSSCRWKSRIYLDTSTYELALCKPFLITISSCRSFSICLSIDVIYSIYDILLNHAAVLQFPKAKSGYFTTKPFIWPLYWPAQWMGTMYILIT